MPSGASARASWALVCAGTTVMRQPLSARSRRMLRLMQKSYATTCRRCGVDLCGFQVLRGGAGVADVRAGERDDLTGVGRIGENFLVTGEGGIENNFACGVALRSDRLAAEDRPIGQREHRRSAHVINSPRRRYTKREEFSANILPPCLD